jgi:hypothetical protein
MNQYATLFDRYWNEAEHYAGLYGINPSKDNDGAWDAFRHAYASAAMSRERSPWMAHVSGDANEILGDRYRSQYSFDKHMDRWNNAVGRRLAEGTADNDEIADRIHDALKKGDLITDPFQDARYYTGPTLLPSPSDYDRNGIYEGELPPPPREPAATGSSNPSTGSFSPSLGINLHSYYGPLLGGRMVIPPPQDSPIPQDEIERIRRGKGIPKGGLF